MEAICSSETSVDTQRTTQRHIIEDGTLHNHRCENLKSYKIGSVHILKTFFFKVYFNIILPYMFRSSKPYLALRFLATFCMQFSSLPRVLQPRPLHPPDLINVIICSDEYKLWSFLLNFFQPPVTTFLTGLNILLSTLFLNTVNSYFPSLYYFNEQELITSWIMCHQFKIIYKLLWVILARRDVNNIKKHLKQLPFRSFQ
jgi:hypothetical protein